MANIFANVGLNMDQLDLNRIYRFGFGAEFLTTSRDLQRHHLYGHLHGRLVPRRRGVRQPLRRPVDRLFLRDGPHHRGNGDGLYRGGTLGRLLCSWGIERASVPAVSLYKAGLTRSTTDDMAIMRSLLGGNDRFDLSNMADLVRGHGGDDTILVRGGHDRLFGGAGQDRIDGGTGADLIRGGAGRDLLLGGADRGARRLPVPLGGGQSAGQGP